MGGGRNISRTELAQHALGKSIWDLSNATWKQSSQHLKGLKTDSLFIVLFLCHLIKTAVLLLHFLLTYIIEIQKEPCTVPAAPFSWCRAPTLYCISASVPVTVLPKEDFGKDIAQRMLVAFFFVLALHMANTKPLKATVVTTQASSYNVINSKLRISI